MLLILCIVLLFSILSILWYLLVRDVIFEDFGDESSSFDETANTNDTDETDDSSNELGGGRSLLPDGNDSDDHESNDNESDNNENDKNNRKESYVCLKNNGKFVVVNSKHKLEFGRKGSNAIFKLVDLEDKDDTIQLESLKYPGYYFYYAQEPCVRTGYYTQKSKQTKFIPMGLSRERKIALIPLGKSYCLENRNGVPVFGRYSPTDLKPSQLFQVEGARVVH